MRGPRSRKVSMVAPADLTGSPRSDAWQRTARAPLPNPVRSTVAPYWPAVPVGVAAAVTDLPTPVIVISTEVESMGMPEVALLSTLHTTAAEAAVTMAPAEKSPTSGMLGDTTVIAGPRGPARPASAGSPSPPIPPASGRAPAAPTGSTALPPY